MSEVVEKVENPYDIDVLFQDSRRHLKNPKISCIFWGPPETGKTFAALTFPGPLKVIDLDGGLAANVKYIPEGVEIQDIKCISIEDDKENINSPNYDPFRVDPIKTLRKFDAVLSALQEVHEGTVVIDTMTAINDWLKDLMDTRIPKSVTPDGKEYVNQFDWKYVNNKYLWLWEKLRNLDVNVVVIARAKPIYVGNAATANMEMDLRPNSEYHASVVVEFKKVVEQTSTGIQVKRVAQFSKFRGVQLSHKYSIEDLTYSKLQQVLKDENKV